MNATIGIYDTHDLAVEAIQELKDGGYPVKQLSIMGKAHTEVVDGEMHIMPKNPIKATSLGVGTVLGTTLGVLAGVGVFAIPGLGFLYGAGAVVGAIAGFDFGLIGGGIASAMATVGVKDENLKKYHDALDAGKFVVIAHGTEDDLKKAHAILDEHGKHSDIEIH